MSATSASAIPNASPVGGGSSSAAQSGPPYLCPTCQTSYSRLEYLRRHERRHADIRPFVCECGKGFSRSDVLSRHKRQCAVHLNGDSADGADTSISSNKSANGKKGSSGRNGKKAGSSSRNGVPRKSGGAARRSDSLHDTPDDDEGSHSPPYTQAAVSHPQPSGAPPTSVGNSFPFPPQPGVQAPPTAPPPLLPPAPYGADGGMLGNASANSPFGGVMQHHLSAFNNLVNQQHHYPSSPESNGTMSQHGSPRFAARDMARHGSNGSRFSLRKGGSFDHIGPRNNATLAASTPNQYAPEFWDALDPAAKNASSTDYVSSGMSTQQPAFSSAEGTSGTSMSAAGGMNGVTTPRGEPQRFAVSTGPLSPFSSIALTSTMSPYLSAFSNARDTPFVASPSRGTIPGTPGASLNVFDWTMRPPSKPASSTMAKRDSFSQPGSGAQSAGMQTSNSSQGLASSPSGPSNGATAVNKRKREGEEGSRKSPRLDESNAVETLDEDQRSAAELLDSLRNAGPRSMTSAASDTALSTTSTSSAGLVSTSLATGPASATAEATSSTDAPVISTISEAPTSQASENVSYTASGAPPEPTTSEVPQGSAPAVPTSTATSKSEPFFEQRNVTAGPEAFLLRLQGGAQEERAGTYGPNSSGNASLVGYNVVDAGGLSLAQWAGSESAGSAARIAQSSWEALMNSDGWAASRMSAEARGKAPFLSDSNLSTLESTVSSASPVGTAPTAMLTPNTDGNLNWLMSPGVQQLINTFAPQPGDGGSYFAGGSSAASTSMTASVPSVQPIDPEDKAVAPSSPTMPLEISALALEKALADVKNPFYVPPHLFRCCYSIPHWNLPPVTRLSMLALHAQQNLLKHFPIIHEPTFRLDTTPGCLAFAMCMLGCHQHGRMWWVGEEVIPRKAVNLDAKPRAEQSELNSDDTSGISRVHDLLSLDMTSAHYDEEDGQVLVRPIVMAEKTDMLMRSFTSLARTEKDQISVVQALVLFQSTRFLNADPSIRAMAAMVHPTIVAMARKASMFDRQAAHSSRKVDYSADDVMRATRSESGNLCFSHSFLPSYLPGLADDEKLWRRWSELAGRRRTAFSLFVMDTVGSLDTGTSTQLALQEVDHLPLPSPDTIWRAPDVKTWRQNLEEYRGPTLRQALCELLEPGEEEWDFAADRPEASIRGRHGPFARFVLMAALLRGIVHFLEECSKGVPSPSPLQPYLDGLRQTWTKGARDDVQALRQALRRWRTAWNEDDLCLAASGPEGRARAAKLQESDSKMTFLGSHHLFTSQTASGATAAMEDALPFYWLGCVLLDHAVVKGDFDASVVRSAASDQTVKALQKVISQFTKKPTSTMAQPVDGMRYDVQQGDGGTAVHVAKQGTLLPDFRSLLRSAKAFVTGGEQAASVTVS